jgi:molecular chaperone Hsp33
MKKKKIPGMSTKEWLIARANDKLFNFLLADGCIRGALVKGTHMVSEIRSQHELGILETLVLGYAYLGACLMAANLKGGDRIGLKIECSGPIRGLLVEANAHGEVRGYLKTHSIPVDKPLKSFDLSPFWGDGFLEVIRYPNYFTTSEQTPTAFNLSVKFDPAGEVAGAGGLLLQAMPGAEPELIDNLENLVYDLPSIGETFAAGRESESFIMENFRNFSPRLIGKRRVEFFCRCQKKSIGQIMARLPVETLGEILQEGPFPLATICQYCNTKYYFEKPEIETLYQKRFH